MKSISETMNQTLKVPEHRRSPRRRWWDRWHENRDIAQTAPAEDDGLPVTLTEAEDRACEVRQLLESAAAHLLALDIQMGRREDEYAQRHLRHLQIALAEAFTGSTWLWGTIGQLQQTYEPAPSSVGDVPESDPLGREVRERIEVLVARAHVAYQLVRTLRYDAESMFEEVDRLLDDRERQEVDDSYRQEVGLTELDAVISGIQEQAARAVAGVDPAVSWLSKYVPGFED